MVLINRIRELFRGREYLLFILPAFIYLTITCIYPLFDALRLSFLQKIGGGKEVFVGLDNYINVVKKEYFLVILGNSFFFTGFSVLFHFLIGLGFALLLHRYLKFGNLWKALQFIPWLFPPVVVGCIWVLLSLPSIGFMNNFFTALNLSNLTYDWLGNPKTALLIVTVANIWTWYPFFTIMILAGLQNIPSVVYEAAQIDGAGSRKRFLYITLPLIKPVILTTCLLDAIWTFRFFDLIWIMTRGGPIKSSEIIATEVYKEAFFKHNFNQAAALGGIMVFIMLIFCLVYLRCYVKEK